LEKGKSKEVEKKERKIMKECDKNNVDEKKLK
jgi:hypothetical protein